MPKLSPEHNAKREAALRANLLKRKAQARAREDGDNPPETPEKSLLTETPAVKDKP